MDKLWSSGSAASRILPCSRQETSFTSANGPLSPITADSIRLSTAIDNDPMQIATSMRIIATAGVPETVKGNTLANLMAGLKGTPYKFTPTASSNGISNGTIDEYYAAMIGQLGVQAQEADRQVTNQQDIVTQNRFEPSIRKRSFTG